MVFAKPDFKASNAIGWAHFVGEIICFSFGIFLSLTPNSISWFVGQMVLAFVFLHAFAMLHEAGHGTLFRKRWPNKLAGHWAGFLAFIPFASWQRIHARHHRYTGWQDLDATTASLVPRALKHWERRVIDFAWASYLPLFSILYRLQNYWNLPRLARFLSHAEDTKRIAIHILWMLGAYALVIYILGFFSILKIFGLGLLLSLVMQDLLILSQHTHIPQRNSNGLHVEPFTAAEQAQFTRALGLPQWLSIALMHIDAHVLHHKYPHVPGYRLSVMAEYKQDKPIGWWSWLCAVKRLSGSDFLFSNSQKTGVHL